MFPFDVDDEEDEELMETDSEAGEPGEYEIDFSTGRLTGRILTGKEAVKQWVTIALGIDRYTYPQYSWDYGNDLHSLIGKEYDREYIKSEAQRMVEDTLAVNIDITGVEDFEIDISMDRLNVKFTILTDYGDEEVEVNV